MAMSLALFGCASTPNGLHREEAAYLVVSNGVATLHTVASNLPAPAGTALEGVLAAGGALLTLWATHLHRSLKELKKPALA